MKYAELNELFAVLVLYRMNFENLHWNSKGLGFDDAHKNISTEYYEKVNDDVDVVAEMLVRLGVNPMNYKEVFDCITNSSNDYMIVASNTLYSKKDVISMSQTLLTNICTAIVAVLDSDYMQETINAGMKSTLETLLDYYDLQARYINSRKLVDQQGDGASQDSAEDDM